MKKNVRILTVLMLVCLLCIQQLTCAQGIKFETNLSWDQIKVKAKKENKLIFVDCFATWCMPCKWMAENIFKQTEVGDYFNDHFVSVTVQMDQTPKDNDNIKIWYKDSKDIETSYSITAFPTFLFFSSDGKPLHRYVGVCQTGNGFIQKAIDAQTPQKQYYVSVLDYKSHLEDSAYLRNAMHLAAENFDRNNFLAIRNSYLNVVSDPISLNNIRILTESFALESPSDRMVSVLLKNLNKANQAYDEAINIRSAGDHFTQMLSITIVQKFIDSLFDTGKMPLLLNEITVSLINHYPQLKDELERRARHWFSIKVEEMISHQFYKMPLDWKKLERSLKEKFPDFDVHELIARKKIQYYKTKDLRWELEAAIIDYLNEFGNRLENDNINDIAWDYIFNYSTSKTLLNEGIEWSYKTLKYYPEVNPNYIDTYANLLYKAGQRNEAIEWEKRAIVLSKRPDDLALFKSNLNKMENGIKTWK